MEPVPVTHTVFNQTPPLGAYNRYATDLGLQSAVHRAGAAEWDAALRAAGAEIGSAVNLEDARLANRQPPLLQSYNGRGEHIDALEFHPAWHALMRGIVARGYHASPWEPGARAGAHAARAAGYLMQAQIECGTLCPTTMTYGAIAALRRDRWLGTEWLPTLLSRDYDSRDLPFAQKRGGLIGMGMTEKQGGSDVRANTTRALRSADGTYRLTGHKWFFSAPQCDAHLVLAQSDRGLSCFFLPRRLADGTRNALSLKRLKDKLGNRSNASAEVEFTNAWAYLLGEEGRGIATILEMGTYTRLDCAIGSAGMMREAVVSALHHAQHRRAFGARLLDQPLMRSVLADLALESAAATALVLRLARCFDSEAESEIALRRALTSAAKFWICKRGCELAAEAMEVLGGNGYTEELNLARLLREMPVNSIWEGSGNIMCLDVLRAFAKSPATRDAVLGELLPLRGQQRDFDAAFERFARLSAAPALPEAHARHYTRLFVSLIQAAELLRAAEGAASTAVAEGYCATRLSAEAGWGAVFGANTALLDTDRILARAWAE
jgi:putative acyl-CoA dehydrogenase